MVALSHGWSKALLVFLWRCLYFSAFRSLALRQREGKTSGLLRVAFSQYLDPWEGKEESSLHRKTGHDIPKS